MTLLAVLIYNRVSRRKQQKKSRAQKEKEEGPTTVIGNHVGHPDINEKRRNFRRNPTFDGEGVMMDRGDHSRSHMVEDDGHFKCPDCHARGQWSNHVRGNRRTEDEVELENGRIHRPPPPPHGNSSLYPRRDRPESTQAHRTDRNTYYRSKSEGRGHGHETSHNESLQRTNKAPEHSMRPGMREPAVMDGFPQHHRVTDRDRNDFHKRLDQMKSQDLRRESRNVTFDLESFNLEQEHTGEERRREKKVKSRDREKERKKKQLRVKLNLSPLRKNKVQPRKKNDQGKSSKKSKEKKQEGKEKDKESRKNGEQEGQGDAAGSQAENVDPGSSQPAQLTHNPNPASLVFTNGQGQSILSGRMQYQQAGMVLRTANQPGTKFSLLGSADPRLTGYSLPLPGSNALLNTVAPAAPALIPGASSVALGTAINAPKVALNTGHSGLSRPPGVGLPPPAAAAQSDSLQARGLQTQGGALPMNPAANTVNNPAPTNPSLPQPHSQTASESAPLAAHHSGPQAVEGPSQRPAEVQLPKTKENLPQQTQAAPTTESSPGVPPQTIGSEPRVDVTSAGTSKSETGNKPAVNENVLQTEGAAAAAASANGVEAGSVSVPVASVQTEPSAGGANEATAAPPLLQQEFISEEGGSSPRRKLRLVLPEKISTRPPTALEKKIR